MPARGHWQNQIKLPKNAKHKQIWVSLSRISAVPKISNPNFRRTFVSGSIIDTFSLYKSNWVITMYIVYRMTGNTASLMSVEDTSLVSESFASEAQLVVFTSFLLPLDDRHRHWIICITLQLMLYFSFIPAASVPSC